MPEGDVTRLAFGISLGIIGLSILLGGALAGTLWCLMGLPIIAIGVVLCVRGMGTPR